MFIIIYSGIIIIACCIVMGRNAVAFVTQIILIVFDGIVMVTEGKRFLPAHFGGLYYKFGKRVL